MKQSEYLKILNMSKRSLEEYLNWGESEIPKSFYEKETTIAPGAVIKEDIQEKFSKNALGSKEELEALKKKIDSCVDCPLVKTRLNAVMGVGSANAELMFVG